MKFPINSEVISTLEGFDRQAVIIKGFNPVTRTYTILDGKRTYFLPEHTLRFSHEELINPKEDIERRLEEYRKLKAAKAAAKPTTERKRYNAFERSE